ncbi:MAG: hypothetical protein R6V10_04030 [bacterium]
MERTEDGFLVKGSVTASDLNAGKGIVTHDDMYINADIKEGPGSKYQKLWESMYVRPPKGAETPYTKGSGPGDTMTKAEKNGVNLAKVGLASFELRKSPVWKAYGGLGEWKKNAPSTVIKKFEGKIPLNYEGKSARVRATLKRSVGGPHAAWPAFFFFHDTVDLGRLGKKQGGSPDQGCADNDKDCDGVANCRDVCPNTKGKPPYRKSMGCPNNQLKLQKGQARAEYILRNQLRETLKCMGIKNAHEHSMNLLFEDKQGGPEYKDQQDLALAPGMPTVFVSVNHLFNFLQDELEAGCGKKKKGLASHGSFYHEFGHYIAEITGMDDVAGAEVTEHNTWKKSNPGLALDEGRADFIMLMMSRQHNRKIMESSDYGKGHAKKLGNRAGNSMEGALTSFWTDVFKSQTPCSALRDFHSAHQEFKQKHGAPQNIKDWITGYDELLYKNYRRGRLPQAEYARRQQAMGKAARTYNIMPDTGMMYLLGNAKGIKDVKYDSKQGRKTVTLDAKVQNRVGFYGPNAYAVVEGRWGKLNVEPLHTDYEVKILKDKLLVTLHKGSVKVYPPGRKPELVKEKSSFPWYFNKKEDSGAGKNHLPEGNLQEANCKVIRGWARDPDTSHHLDIHVYMDKPGGDKNFLTGFPAKQHRPELPFPDKKHGFRISTPEKLKDGKVHKIYVYAIDAQGGKNPMLKGSPAKIKCTNVEEGGGNNNIDARKAYQEYISAYNRLTDLMSQGKGDTPEAKKAYQDYKKAKARYEKAINKK